MICIAFMMIGINTFAQNLDLAAIRKDFNKGVKDEELCKQRIKLLEKYDDIPEAKGYEAVFRMFMAKHSGNPLKKMSYFNSGKNILEKQIKANPSNTELRFIRLCVQYYIPAFLGYKDNIPQDKTFLIDNLYKMKDTSVKSIIYNHLKGAKMFTEKELELLGR